MKLNLDSWKTRITLAITILGFLGGVIGGAVALDKKYDDSDDIKLITMNYDEKFLRDDVRYYEQQLEKLDAKYDIKNGGRITDPRDKRNYEYYEDQLKKTEEKLRK